MKIEKIQSVITPKTTGYFAAGSLGLAAVSGLSNNKNVKKTHKLFAYLSAAFTLLHIGLMEYYRYKFNHQNRS